MNLAIKKNELNNALNIVSKAISSNSPQPTLRGIKMEVENDSLILTGSDSDISIQTILHKNEENNLTVIEEGSILIDAKYMMDIVRKIDSENVSIEVIDGSLTRFAGKSAEFKINGMNVNDYPHIDFSKPVDFVSMKASLLSTIIRETAFASSIKETRPVLTGVNFKLENNSLTVTATDSYRLARKIMQFESEGSFNITIPARSLNDVQSTILVDDNADIIITQNNKKAQFWCNDTVLQTRLLDGSYPETDRLIPESFASSFIINREDLIHAIDRTTFIKTDNMTIDRLQLSQEECILTNRSQEIGESHENLDGKFEGEPFDISFSGNYVMDAAKALSGMNIKMKFNGTMKPFILTSMEDPTILQLVLPVRTYN